METQSNLLNEFTEPSFEYASAWQRFLNYFIDFIAFYILIVLFGFIAGMVFASRNENPDMDSFLGFTTIIYAATFVIMLLYYTLLESAKGKALGKLITKTKVVTEDGQPITYKQAFMRTIIRFVPLEFLSGFSGTTMWHDQWTRTMVVKDK